MPHLALKELRVLIRKYPNEADLLNLMGLTQLSLNNSQVAVKYFNRSYKASPSISVALNLSSSYINLQQYSKAIKLLKKVKKSSLYEDYQYPERINHNLGLAYEKSKKNGLAKKYYKSALQFNPVYYLTLMRVGELYRRSGKIKTSMKYFYKAKASCGVCYDPVKAISHNYVALGQGSKAVPLVKSFLKTKDLSPLNRQKAAKLLRYTKKNTKHKRTVRRKRKPIVANNLS